MIDRTVHMASKLDSRGNVSALCYAKPRGINLENATWTIRPGAVTCKACIAVMKAQAAERNFTVMQGGRR